MHVVGPVALPKVYETYDFISPTRFAGKLQGKVVIVTGASSGVGREACLAFAAAGAAIAAVARRQNLLDELVAGIKSKHDVPCIAIAMDVSDPSAAMKIVDRAEKALGPVDVLLNGAVITRMGLLHAETDFSTWWRVLEVNLRGSVALCHAVLPSMIERKTGVVMSATSIVAAQDFPFITAYGASKAAITKFHQTLALEVARYGILSLSVHPGAVDTEIYAAEAAVQTAVLEEPEAKEMFEWYVGMKKQSLKLMGDVCVALCCEDRCRVLNGRYVDCEVSLESVVEEMEADGGVRAKKENLYRLKVDGL